MNEKCFFKSRVQERTVLVPLYNFVMTRNLTMCLSRSICSGRRRPQTAPIRVIPHALRAKALMIFCVPSFSHFQEHPSNVGDVGDYTDPSSDTCIHSGGRYLLRPRSFPKERLPNASRGRRVHKPTSAIIRSRSGQSSRRVSISSQTTKRTRYLNRRKSRSLLDIRFVSAWVVVSLHPLFHSSHSR